jgi:hypothetical protein
MEFRDHGAQQWRIGGMYRARDSLDEFMANFAIFVTHRETVEYRRIGGLSNVHIFGHAMPRRFDRIAQLV